MLESGTELFRPARPSGAYGETHAPSSDALFELLGALRRQKWIIGLFVALGLAIAAAILVFVKPGFVATATLLIDTRKYENVSKSELVGRMALDSSAAIDSQLEILKSYKVALAVVNQMQLADDPDFAVPRLSIRRVLFGWWEKGAPPPSREDRVDRAVAYFDDHLAVKRVGDTFAVDVSFEAKHADRAAEVANAAAAAYAKVQAESQDTALQQASEWLEKRLRELSEKSLASQQAVVEFKAKNNLLQLAGGIEEQKKRLAELNARLDAVLAQETDAKVRIGQLDAILKTDSDPALLSSINGVTNDERITKLRGEYVELSNRYKELQTKLSPTHQALVDLRSQMDQVHGALVAQFAMVRVGLQNDADLSVQRRQAISRQVEEALAQSRAVDIAQGKLQQLDATAQTYRNLYDNFLQHYAESLQQQNSPAAHASIITPASPPTIRNYKKFLLIVAAFPAAGLALGVGLGALREFIGQVFWTPQSVELNLQLTCFALVPKLSGGKQPLRRLLRRPREFDSLSGGSTRIVERNEGNVAWRVLDEPFTRFAEALRSLRVAIRDANERGQKIIGVTSTLPQEGKSTIALALALTAAKGGARVLLVDCDMRNPALSNSLAPSADRGIPEVLDGSVGLHEIEWVEPTTGLTFIPGVTYRPLATSSDILASAGNKQLFDSLRQSYDLILVDLPPLAPIVDAAASVSFVDGYVFVVEWGRTKIDAVKHALRSVPQVHQATITAVLSKTDYRRLAKYNSNLDSYYFSTRDGGYGINEK